MVLDCEGHVKHKKRRALILFRLLARRGNKKHALPLLRLYSVQDGPLPGGNKRPLAVQPAPAAMTAAQAKQPASTDDGAASAGALRDVGAHPEC